MKLFYIANSRIPTEKAHGIQIMKTCEAFVLRGIDVELILPWRFNKIKQDPFEYYGVKKNFSARGGSPPEADGPRAHAFGEKITKVLSLDLIPLGLPKIGFWVQAATFGFFATLYLLLKSKPEDIIYSRDEFSLWFLSFLAPLDILNLTGLPGNLFWEAHTFPGSPRKYHKILKKIKGLVAISHGLKKSFQDVGVSEEKILVAPDAVDLAQFDVKETQKECRKKLGLPLDKKIVLYTGHLYKWKGADVLMESSEFLSENTLVYLVGGTEEDVESYKLKAASCKNAVFVGHRPHREVPYWLKAADVLVLPNSSKEKISAIYTSPLKLFEYMAAGKPIIASALPSLREILNENTAVLVEPDNPEALAKGIEKVLKDGVLAEKIAQNAAEKAKNYTWEKRAQNILTFLLDKAIMK